LAILLLVLIILCPHLLELCLLLCILSNGLLLVLLVLLELLHLLFVEVVLL
jgi:hypothetical protein